MPFFRHKTQKARFQLIFAAAILIQGLAFYSYKELVPQSGYDFKASVNQFTE